MADPGHALCIWSEWECGQALRQDKKNPMKQPRTEPIMSDWSPDLTPWASALHSAISLLAYPYHSAAPVLYAFHGSDHLWCFWEESQQPEVIHGTYDPCLQLWFAVFSPFWTFSQIVLLLVCGCHCYYVRAAHLPAASYLSMTCPSSRSIGNWQICCCYSTPRYLPPLMPMSQGYFAVYLLSKNVGETNKWCIWPWHWAVLNILPFSKIWFQSWRSHFPLWSLWYVLHDDLVEKKVGMRMLVREFVQST